MLLLGVCWAWARRWALPGECLFILKVPPGMDGSPHFTAETQCSSLSRAAVFAG